MNTIFRDDNLELYTFCFLSLRDIYNFRLVSKDYDTLVTNRNNYEKNRNHNKK